MTGPFASHPSDPISRHTAQDATADGLTAHFEHILGSGESMPHRYGSLQALCAQSIARVQLLERDLEERDLRLAGLFDRTDNVVPLNRFKPGGSVA